MQATAKKEQASSGTTEKDRSTREELVHSLIGAIPDTGKTLEEYRKERLQKY